MHPKPQLPTWLARPDGFLLERIAGLLVWNPFLWIIAFALVIAWVQRKAPPRPFPRLELTSIGVSVGALLVVLSMAPATMRYLADFAALLEITAVISWFYLDQRLAAAPRLRRVSRVVGVILLLVGVVFGPMFALAPPTHYMDG